MWTHLYKYLRLLLYLYIQVEEGGKVTLTGSEIRVTDPDTITDNLIIVIDEKPGFGDIIDSAPGKFGE